MTVPGEDGGGDRGDVAGVDHGDRRVAGRRAHGPPLPDRIALIQDVLHEDVGPQDGPIQIGLPQDPLHVVVPDPDDRLGVIRRAQGGYFHHVFYTHLGCRVDGVLLKPDHVTHVAGEQEKPLGTGEDPRQGLPVGQVRGHPLDPGDGFIFRRVPGQGPD